MSLFLDFDLSDNPLTEDLERQFFFACGADLESSKEAHCEFLEKRIAQGPFHLISFRENRESLVRFATDVDSVFFLRYELDPCGSVSERDLLKDYVEWTQKHTNTCSRQIERCQKYLNALEQCSTTGVAAGNLQRKENNSIQDGQQYQKALGITGVQDVLELGEDHSTWFIRGIRKRSSELSEPEKIPEKAREQAQNLVEQTKEVSRPKVKNFWLADHLEFEQGGKVSLEEAQTYFPELQVLAKTGQITEHWRRPELWNENKRSFIYTFQDATHVNATFGHKFLPRLYIRRDIEQDDLLVVGLCGVTQERYRKFKARFPLSPSRYVQSEVWSYGVHGSLDEVERALWDGAQIHVHEF